MSMDNVRRRTRIRAPLVTNYDVLQHASSQYSQAEMHSSPLRRRRSRLLRLSSQGQPCTRPCDALSRKVEVLLALDNSHGCSRVIQQDEPVVDGLQDFRVRKTRDRHPHVVFRRDLREHHGQLFKRSGQPSSIFTKVLTAGPHLLTRKPLFRVDRKSATAQVPLSYCCRATVTQRCPDGILSFCLPSMQLDVCV